MAQDVIAFLNSDKTVSSVTAATPLPTTGGSGASATQTQGTAASNAAAVGNPVLTGGIYESTPSTYDNGDVVSAHTDSRGNLKVAIYTPDGTTGIAAQATSADASAGASTSLRTSANSFIFNGATWDREKKSNAVSRILSAAADTNATSAKASAGDLFVIHGHNASATARYLKLYNKASAPTVGTDTPVMTLYLPPLLTFKFEFNKGHYFSTGIAYALTTGVADADTGALTAADVLGLNVVYA